MTRVQLCAALVPIAILCMAPNRRSHDHIGNFNFKVAPAGVDGTTFYLDAVEGSKEPVCFGSEFDAVLLRFDAALGPAALTALQNATSLVVSGPQTSITLSGVQFEEYGANSPVGPAALLAYSGCD